MNEQKRRGRPPKVVAVLEGGDVPPINDYPDAGAERAEVVWSEIAEHEAAQVDAMRAQAYAMRVWNGQSDTVIRQERVARVKAALEGQNLPFDGVVLPEAV